MRGNRGGERDALRLATRKVGWRGAPNRLEAEGGEITAAPLLLAGLVLKGKLITGDAIHAQRKLCGQIVDGGGEYLLAVKENQPTLLGEIVDVFRSPAPASPFLPTPRRTSTGRGPSVARSGSAASWPVGASGRDC